MPHPWHAILSRTPWRYLRLILQQWHLRFRPISLCTTLWRNVERRVRQNKQPRIRSTITKPKLTPSLFEFTKIPCPDMGRKANLYVADSVAWWSMYFTKYSDAVYSMLPLARYHGTNHFSARKDNLHSGILVPESVIWPNRAPHRQNTSSLCYN